MQQLKLQGAVKPFRKAHYPCLCWHDPLDYTPKAGFVGWYLPSVKNNRRKQIDEEKLLIKLEYVRAWSVTCDQNNDSSTEALHRTTHAHTVSSIDTFLLLHKTDKIFQGWKKIESLTSIRAVIDSFIHRFSSNKCPNTMQAHRSVTNRQMAITCVWSASSPIPALDIRNCRVPAKWLETGTISKTSNSTHQKSY